MHLSQLDAQQAGRFRSVHSLFHDLADGRTVLMLSGLAEIALRAPGWSNEAADVPVFLQTIDLDIALPAGFLAEGQQFVIEQSLPQIALGSLQGVGNVCWGLRQFSIAGDAAISRSVRLQAELEVARSSETLKDLSYAITLLGRRR